VFDTQACPLKDRTARMLPRFGLAMQQGQPSRPAGGVLSPGLRRKALSE
jgi:hypothetical protein